ncbi:MAG: MgtC/SapB family protein [Sporomusaceae bacterium]|nr:MgtC/SapB family protein [Sporomusaceae bacterium]
MTMEWEMAARLVVSCVLGGIIGYEREAHRKAAGLRTHILVSIGSCLIMILSVKIYASVQGLTNADPTRMAAQVVSGIGFLGAGSILKDGPSIKGLTTAASLWVVSGVGLAVGSGYYMGALLTTGLVFITLTIISRLENKEYKSLVNLFILSADMPGQIGEIGSLLGSHGIHIRDIKMEEKKELLSISLRVFIPPGVSCSKVAIGLSSLKGITSVKMDP